MTTYFGLFTAVVWGIAPAVFLAGLVSAEPTPVTFFVGYLGDIAVATGSLASYFAVGSYAPLSDPDGELFALVRTFVSVYTLSLLGLLLGLLWLAPGSLPPWFRWLGTAVLLALGTLLTLTGAVERRASAP